MRSRGPGGAATAGSMTAGGNSLAGFRGKSGAGTSRKRERPEDRRPVTIPLQDRLSPADCFAGVGQVERGGERKIRDDPSGERPRTVAPFEQPDWEEEKRHADRKASGELPDPC